MTKEPENYGEPWSCREGNAVVFTTKYGRNGSIAIEGGSAENSRLRARVIACVNACAGIPTEELERASIPSMYEILERIVKSDDLTTLEHDYIETMEAHAHDARILLNKIKGRAL